MLSADNWIAGSGNWDAGSNWSLGNAPGTGDTAVINTSSAAIITIQSSDTIQIQNVTTASNDTLSIAGGSLMVTSGTSTLSGALSMSGGSLTAFGSGVVLNANGSTGISGASLFSDGGAAINFAQATPTTPINLSTGLNSSGSLITKGGQSDANWTVQEPNGGTGAAQTVFPNNPDWFVSWPANGPHSDWIAVNAKTSSQPPAPYTFTRTFDLTGYNLATVGLAGDWNIDDKGTLALNGHTIDTENDPYNNGGQFPGFFVSGASGFFNQGLNTLTITMTSSDQVKDAVRLDGLLVTGGLAELANSTLSIGAGSSLSLPATSNYFATNTKVAMSADGATLSSGGQQVQIPPAAQSSTIDLPALSPGMSLVLPEGNLVASSDAVGDFSLASNPIGPWSYLYDSGSGPQLLTVPVFNFQSNPGLDVWWNGQNPDNLAAVGRNATATTFTVSNTVVVSPDLLNLDPELNKDVMVRWTAPSSGTWSFNGLFQGDDTKEVSHNVEILENSSTALLNPTAISSFGQQVPFQDTVTLNAGDTIDFVVLTPGTSGNLSTGLSVDFTQGTFPNAVVNIAAGANVVLPAGNYLTNTTFNVGAGAHVVLSGGSYLGGATFNVASGATVDLTGGQTTTFGGVVTGTGTGTVSLNSGTLQVGSSGATFNMAGKLFQWTGGTIDVSQGSFTNTGTINYSGAGNAVLNGAGILIDKKSMLQTSTGALALNNGATLDIVKGGTYNIESNGGIGVSGGGTLIDAGTLEKTKGTGTSTIDTATLTNTGTVKVSSGTLDIAATVSQVSNNTLTAGSWSVSSTSTVAATLNLSSASFTTIGAAAKVTLSGPKTTFSNLSGLGSIAKGGSLTLAGGAALGTSGALTNNGSLTIGPGSVLTVDGSFTQSSTATLAIQLGGTDSAPTFGQLLSTTGSVSLAGKLSVTSTVVPAVGSSFNILDNEGNAAIGGAFANLAEGATFTVKKGTTAMTFKISYAGSDDDGSNNVVITRTA